MADRKNMIPYFSVDMDNSSPGWFQQIESSLTPSGSPCYLKELEFTKIFEEPVRWQEEKFSLVLPNLIYRTLEYLIL